MSIHIRTDDTGAVHVTLIAPTLTAALAQLDRVRCAIAALCPMNAKSKVARLADEK